MRLQLTDISCGIEYKMQKVLLYLPLPFLHLCITLISRYERLEDQLNDLTELHQHEMANLKQELASIEERVSYQAQERARDIQVYI